MPGLVFTNSSDGRIVWAVVCMAPDTMASARPSLHHHRAEVADVGHDVVCALEVDALVAAQLVVAPPEPFEQLAVERVDHRHVVDEQPEFGSPFAHGVGVAEEGEVAHLAAPDAVGGAQDPVVGAFGQDDVSPSSAGAFDELVLEHDWCHHVGATDLDAFLQRSQVDVGFDVAECDVDLALVAGGDRTLDRVGSYRGVVGVGVRPPAAGSESRRTSRRSVRPLSGRAAGHR